MLWGRGLFKNNKIAPNPTVPTRLSERSISFHTVPSPTCFLQPTHMCMLYIVVFVLFLPTASSAGLGE